MLMPCSYKFRNPEGLKRHKPFHGDMPDHNRTVRIITAGRRHGFARWDGESWISPSDNRPIGGFVWNWFEITEIDAFTLMGKVKL